MHTWMEFERNEKGYVLSTEQWFPHTPAELFPFFADAANLQRITPPWLGFSILTPGPIEMRVGTRIDYRLRVHGLPIRWRTEITEWEPPHRFVDEQLRGPYRLWRHEHSFVARDGGCMMADRVQYRAPGGVLVQPIVGRDLGRIFGYRRVQLEQLFSHGDRPDPAPAATT